MSTTDPVCNTTATSKATILGTCVTTVESQGKLQKARALMDNDSSLTFITSRMVNSLKIRKTAEFTSATGFQQKATPISKYKVEFHLRMSSATVTQTEEEVAALEHFQSTHSRQDNGSYVVKLPRKMNILA